MTAALPGLARRLLHCAGVLVDSNVLLDIATQDEHWCAWSESALAECAELVPLIVNPIIYAEVSVGFETIERLDAVLPGELYVRRALPWEAGFLAGKSFVTYRRRGGSRTAPLPDFYIGGHAAVDRLALLTRDASRYRMYFPRLEVLSPGMR